VEACAELASELCAAQNASNSCDNAFAICNGDTPFTTVGATTDGFPAQECAFFGDNQVQADVWFDYVATCTGALTVSTCNSTGYDTKLAVYDGCDCPTTAVLGCNDDTPGCDLTSSVAIPVAMSNCYKIRVGGYNGATGSGTLRVLCGE